MLIISKSKEDKNTYILLTGEDGFDPSYAERVWFFDSIFNICIFFLNLYEKDYYHFLDRRNRNYSGKSYYSIKDIIKHLCSELTEKQRNVILNEPMFKE